MLLDILENIKSSFDKKLYPMSSKILYRAARMPSFTSDRTIRKIDEKADREKREIKSVVDDVLLKNGRVTYTVANRVFSLFTNVGAQQRDFAMTKGGIDFNAANLNLQIKRDGKGVLITHQPKELGEYPY